MGCPPQRSESDPDVWPVVELGHVPGFWALMPHAGSLWGAQKVERQKRVTYWLSVLPKCPKLSVLTLQILDFSSAPSHHSWQGRVTLRLDQSPIQLPGGGGGGGGNSIPSSFSGNRLFTLAQILETLRRGLSAAVREAFALCLCG